MARRWAEVGPERPQDGPEMAARWPEDRPEIPKMAPGGPKTTPKWGLKTALTGPAAQTENHKKLMFVQWLLAPEHQ